MSKNPYGYLNDSTLAALQAQNRYNNDPSIVALRQLQREIEWLRLLDGHLRTQIRVIILKQWKVPRKREWGLLKLGVPKWIAHKVAN